MNPEIQRVLDGESEGCIVCGNCLPILESMPDGCVDLVLTDPPYGIGYSAMNGADRGEPVDWDNVAGDDSVDGRWLIIARERTREGGACYFTCRWDVEPQWCACSQEAGWKIKQRLTWYFDAHGKGDLLGTWAPVCEDILFLTKGRHILTSRPPSLIHVCRVPTWEIRYHPHQKPIGLMARIISVSTILEGLILDPFCGSGTTCVAAKKLGRRYIGIDISEEYCQIARDRLKSVDTGVPVREMRAGQIPLFE